MENNEMLFNFAYDQALNDATRRTAYKEKGKFIFYDDEEHIIKDCVRAYIKEVTSNVHSEADYKLAGEYADKIVDLVKMNYHKYGSFTFGNAQKLINMTAKYLYVGTYLLDSDLKEKIRRKFEVCDCPIDRYIVGELNKNMTIPLDFSWSRISDDNGKKIYYEMQKEIRIKCKAMNWIPLEFDFVMWRENAVNIDISDCKNDVGLHIRRKNKEEEDIIKKGIRGNTLNTEIRSIPISEIDSFYIVKS